MHPCSLSLTRGRASTTWSYLTQPPHLWVIMLWRCSPLCFALLTGGVGVLTCVSSLLFSCFAGETGRGAASTPTRTTTLTWGHGCTGYPTSASEMRTTGLVFSVDVIAVVVGVLLLNFDVDILVDLIADAVAAVYVHTVMTYPTSASENYRVLLLLLPDVAVVVVGSVDAVAVVLVDVDVGMVVDVTPDAVAAVFVTWSWHWWQHTRTFVLPSLLLLQLVILMHRKY